MTHTPNTPQTELPDYNIEKESVVNATNELLKWYHGCTSHFIDKAMEIIESSDNPDIIGNVFADFLNDEAAALCQAFNLQTSGNDAADYKIPLIHDSVFDLDYEDDKDMTTISRKRLLDLECELENVRNHESFYKFGLEAEMVRTSCMIVDIRHLKADNEMLKNKLNELLYGNKES